MRALWDDVEATAVFSIQLYESYKHFYVLNRYLGLVDYRPIEESELLEIRRRNLDRRVDDAEAELARYMLSEHFAAYFFLRLSRQAKEPVLAQIAGFIAKDEFRHTQFAFDLLDARLKKDPELPRSDSSRGERLPARGRRRRGDSADLREKRSSGHSHVEPAHAPAVWRQPRRFCQERNACP